MSLRRLYKNYFTVVTTEFAPHDSEGAIERKFHFVPVEGYINVRGAFQGISRKDVVEVYGKKEDTPLIKLYHSFRELQVTSKHAILTALDPLQSITDFNNTQNLVLLQYIGQRDPVQHKPSRRVPLEIILEKNHRWEF